MHGNVTGWPATTTRSCGCWENMASTPDKEQTKKGQVSSNLLKSQHYFNITKKGEHWKFKIKEESKCIFNKHQLLTPRVLNEEKNDRKCTICPFPPISLKPLVKVRLKETLKGDLRMWHIPWLFMIWRQVTVHASEVSAEHQDWSAGLETAVTARHGSFMKDVTVQMGWARTHHSR